MHDLEFIRGSRGSPGNDVAARCSEPPFPTHGGQGDGSYINSLKSSMIIIRNSSITSIGSLQGPSCNPPIISGNSPIIPRP